MELIDRNAVREFIKSYSHSTDVVYHMEKHLYEVPTIDAVPVVRCKDCKHWRRYGLDVSNRKEYGRCEWIDSTTHTPYEDWFCADGERREG